MFSNRPSTTSTTNLSCHGFPWPLSPFCAYRVSTLTGLSTPPAPALTITPKNFLALAPLQGRSPQTHNTFTHRKPQASLDHHTKAQKLTAVFPGALYPFSPHMGKYSPITQ